MPHSAREVFRHPVTKRIEPAELHQALQSRQAILFERQFAADSPAGQLICDTLVPDGDMDAALGRTVEALTSSGVVSAAGNRKAMRLGQESIDLFRQYMAVYCREQAYCHYSPQLIRNLEQNWNAASRSL